MRVHQSNLRGSFQKCSISSLLRSRDAPLEQTASSSPLRFSRSDDLHREETSQTRNDDLFNACCCSVASSSASGSCAFSSTSTVCCPPTAPALGRRLEERGAGDADSLPPSSPLEPGSIGGCSRSESASRSAAPVSKKSAAVTLAHRLDAAASRRAMRSRFLAEMSLVESWSPSSSASAIAFTSSSMLIAGSSAAAAASRRAHALPRRARKEESRAVASRSALSPRPAWAASSIVCQHCRRGGEKACHSSAGPALGLRALGLRAAGLR